MRSVHVKFDDWNRPKSWKKIDFDELQPKVITKRLLMEYTWEVEPNEDLTYKWLPVSRPKNNVKVKFTKRERID